jgi:hypothetical protein
MANPLVGIFRIKELRERIFFTVVMLIVFRLGAVIPVPGINVRELNAYFLSQQNSGNAIVDYLDFFAGGAFSNFSVFMLGIMPYISMSIIMQRLLIVFPGLKKLSQEEGGKKKIQAYQRYGTVIVCLIQSYAVTQYAQIISRSVENLLTMNLLPFTLLAMLSVTTGTLLMMWMGEQITKRGIGNGISLLIFAGIVARLPDAVWELIGRVTRGELNPVFVLVVLFMFVAVIALVVYEQQGQRKITVHYAKTCCRQEDVRRAEHLHPVQDKSVRGNTRHLCVFYFDVPVADSVNDRRQCPLACGGFAGALTARNTVQCFICFVYNLFCLFLYTGYFEYYRDSEKYTRKRRFYTGNTDGKNRGISDKDTEQNSLAGILVSRPDCGNTDDNSGAVQLPVIYLISHGRDEI